MKQQMKAANTFSTVVQDADELKEYEPKWLPPPRKSYDELEKVYFRTGLVIWYQMSCNLTHTYKASLSFRRKEA